MNWRNPKKELPNEQQIVWVMLEPHKWRGSMEKSVESIEIVCGQYLNGVVENWDELGLGSQVWDLKGERDRYHNILAIAWMPVEEMTLPEYNG